MKQPGSRLDRLSLPAPTKHFPVQRRHLRTRHFQRGSDAGPRTTGSSPPTPPPPPPGPPSSVYIPPAGGSGSVWLVSALAGNYQTIRILNYFDIGSVESCHFPENKVGLWARGPPHRPKDKQREGRGAPPMGRERGLHGENPAKSSGDEEFLLGPGFTHIAEDSAL